MVTASIVLFHTPGELLEKVARSYSPDAGHKLYLIDNSETRSKLAEKMAGENVEYIFNGKNMGYGRAHNIGIEKAIAEKADYHVILNPDLEFDPSLVPELARYADRHGDVACMMPKVLDPGGETQYLCKLLPCPSDLFFRRFMSRFGIAKRKDDRYALKGFGYDRIINPPCLSGCFMFMRTSVLEKSGIRFDGRFFMYCEDFDLVRRLHRVGKTIYYPYVSVIHRHGRESYKNGRMLRIHMASAFKYFNKYGWFFDRERKRMNEEILRETGLL